MTKKYIQWDGKYKYSFRDDITFPLVGVGVTEGGSYQEESILEAKIDATVDKMIKECGYGWRIVGDVLEVFDDKGDVCKAVKGDYLIQVEGTIAVTRRMKHENR